VCASTRPPSWCLRCRPQGLPDCLSKSLPAPTSAQPGSSNQTYQNGAAKSVPFLPLPACSFSDSSASKTWFPTQLLQSPLPAKPSNLQTSPSAEPPKRLQFPQLIPSTANARSAVFVVPSKTKIPTLLSVVASCGRPTAGRSHENSPCEPRANLSVPPQDLQCERSWAELFYTHRVV